MRGSFCRARYACICGRFCVFFLFYCYCCCLFFQQHLFVRRFSNHIPPLPRRTPRLVSSGMHANNYEPVQTWWTTHLHQPFFLFLFFSLYPVDLLFSTCLVRLVAELPRLTCSPTPGRASPPTPHSSSPPPLKKEFE